MIKILHTADIHLGRQFASLHHKGEEYRSQLLRTFEKTMELAMSEQASLVLIAGDLFDSNRVHGVTVSRVVNVFKKLEKAGIRVCIIPGTHDAYTEDGIYRLVHFPKNVAVLSGEMNRQIYPDLNLAVYGILENPDLLADKAMESLHLASECKFHVGMAHCSLKRPDIASDDGIALDMESIGKSGLDYLALGHWHSFQTYLEGNTKICYPGSPEIIDFDQKGAGSVGLVTMKEKGDIAVEAVRVGTKKFEAVTIDVSPLENLGDIIKAIEDKADPNLILELTLTGDCTMIYNLDVTQLENELNGRFFNLRIKNNTYLLSANGKLPKFPEKTITGRFIRILEEKIAVAPNEQEKSLYEESLKLGVALLQKRLQL